MACFTDKVCLVTGAGSAIGRAIAGQFAREGAIASSQARFITGTTLLADGGRLDLLP